MKKINASILFAVLLLVFQGVPAAAQKLQETLATYGANYGQEKVYLHYDKTAYAPGETIWFKAYLMEGIYPADESKTLYVDWVDPKGVVLSHLVAPLIEGVTNGQFDVPADYAGGSIHVRAYTRWMLNFDSAFLYDKDIRIISRNPAPAPAAAARATAPVLQFFPEGGDLVRGVRSRVAFKATDYRGRPIAVTGVIRDNKGAVVDSLRTRHDGMGFFSLEPAAGQTFTAHWKEGKGAERTTALPAAKETGVNLMVTAEGARKRFTITRPADAAEALKKLHIIGTMHGNMTFEAHPDLSARNSMQGVIPTEQFPTGVLTITVFDAAWKPLAERITFVKNNDYLFEPELEVTHWGLNKRARNELVIKVPDSIGANLSISVTDVAIHHDSSEHIQARLLLTSDIKGQVHQPGYYFSANNETVNTNLDLVMMTHGWRRFNWEALAAGKLPPITFPRDTTYLTLSGRIYGVDPAQLRSGATIVMIAKTKDTSTMVMVPVEPSGRFRDPDFLFFDTLQVYHQIPGKRADRGDVRLMEDRLPAPNYSTLAAQRPPFALPADTTGSARQAALAADALRLKEAAQSKMMQNITVTARTKPPLQVLDEKYASGMFRSGADGFQFDLVNDVSAAAHMSIFTYLQGKVPGLQITGGGSNVSLQWRGQQPALFVDQMPAQADLLSSIPVTDIAYVKVFRPPFMGAAGGGAGGAIAIYTRRGNDVQSAPGKGLSSNTVTGYSVVRQFYAPNYASFDRRNEERDLRTTLYWNPQLTTAGNQRTLRITFYNNDVSEAFRVVIEGMTRDGRLAHIEQVLE